MHAAVSAQLWRAAAVALATGWVVMACGGGGGDELRAAPPNASAAEPPQPPPMNAAAAAPCPSFVQPVTPVPVQPDTATLEREFSETLRTEMAAGMSTGAGTVEMADPFERQ